MVQEKELELLEEERLVEWLNTLHEVSEHELDTYNLPRVSEVSKKLRFFPTGMLKIIQTPLKPNHGYSGTQETKKKYSQWNGIKGGISLSSMTPTDSNPNLPIYMDTKKPLDWVAELSTELHLDNIYELDGSDSQTSDVSNLAISATSDQWPTGEYSHFIEKSKVALTFTKDLLANIQKAKQKIYKQQKALKLNKIIKYKPPTIEYYEVLPMKRYTSSQRPFSIGSDDYNKEHFFEYQKYRNGLSDFYRQAEAANNTEIKYRLPGELSDLTGLTVLEYLSKYCYISPNQTVVYKRLFAETQVPDRLDGGRVAINDKVKEMLYGCITEAHLNEFFKLLDLPKFGILEAPSFILIMALADRLYGEDMMAYSNEHEKYQANALERLDFSNIAHRLVPLNINPNLAYLLTKLEATGFYQTKGPEERITLPHDVTERDSTTLSTFS